MTRQRYDDHSTELGLWIRGDKNKFLKKTGQEMVTDVKSIGSRRYIIGGLFVGGPQEIVTEGYVAQNLDYVWYCYGANKKKLMLLEEKRFGEKRKQQDRILQAYSQRIAHGIIDTALKYACEAGCTFEVKDGQYKRLAYYGYHLIEFQNTNPEDGWIEVDGMQIDIDTFLAFLRFEWMPDNDERQRRTSEAD